MVSRLALLVRNADTVCTDKMTFTPQDVDLGILEQVLNTL
jgi:hypothetical protein